MFVSTVIRGTPDPEFCYPAGSRSMPNPDMLDLAGSGSEPDPSHSDPAGSRSGRIWIQTSTTADNTRKIALSAPQLKSWNDYLPCFVTELLLE